MASVSVEDKDGPGCLAGLVAWLWVGRGARKEEEASMNLVGGNGS